MQAMLAGGTGGTCGDMLMHSLDTVKTRQQGDPHFPPRYTSMTSSYATIYRQEGILRGLYGGVTPALLGSFPGTLIFFGVYEFTKRKMLDAGINANVAYLSGGKDSLDRSHSTSQVRFCANQIVAQVSSPIWLLLSFMCLQRS
jgi:hypothetical protein